MVVLNATDKDLGANATFEMIIVSSNLYNYGSVKSTGSIVPSPFGMYGFLYRNAKLFAIFAFFSFFIVVSRDGRLSTASYMAEYNQDHFELDIVAKETESPEREALVKVFVCDTVNLKRFRRLFLGSR